MRRNSFDPIEALGTTFGLVFKNIGPVLLISLVVTSVHLLPGYWLDGNVLGLKGTFLPTIIGLALGSGCQVILLALLVPGLFDSMRGESPSLGQFLNSGVKSFGDVLPCAALSMLGTIVGMLLLCVPGFLLMVFWYVALPCAVVEKRGAVESFSRSVLLTAGARWRIVALVIILGLIGLSLSLLLQFVVGPPIDIKPLTGWEHLAVHNPTASLAHWVLTAIASILGVTAQVVTYRDLRVEKEGIYIDAVEDVFE